MAVTQALFSLSHGFKVTLCRRRVPAKSQCSAVPLKPAHIQCHTSRAGAGAPPVRQQCIPAPQVVDTTGAGDCFTAAFAVAVLEGLEPQRALRFASAAASICVQRAGAMPSLPSREEVDALVDKLGWQSCN